MIKPFKFLEGRPPRLYRYGLSINMDRYNITSLGDLAEEPPFGLSRRHWNMMPQDLRGSTVHEMLCFIHGWEDARNNIEVNPYHDRTRRRLWLRGYLTLRDRINREV